MRSSCPSATPGGQWNERVLRRQDFDRQKSPCTDSGRSFQSPQCGDSASQSRGRRLKWIEIVFPRGVICATLAWPRAASIRSKGGHMNTEHGDDVRAFVQTAEQASGYVWVITLVDFTTRQVKRSLVSDENYVTRAAAQDAGDARLKALSGDA
jgi:hypothetical protein